MHPRPVIVASHPRSGTHLMIDALRKNFRSTRSWKIYGAPCNRLYFNLDMFVDLSSRKASSSDLGKKILRRPDRPIIKTHFLRSFDVTYEGARLQDFDEYIKPYLNSAIVIFIKRDPVESLSSLHRLMGPSHPMVREMSLTEFSIYPIYDDGMSPLERWKSYMSGYLADDSVAIFDFRQIILNPRKSIECLAELLSEEPIGFDLPKKSPGVWGARFQRLVSLSPESTEVLAKKPVFGSGPPSVSQADMRFIYEETSGFL